VYSKVYIQAINYSGDGRACENEEVKESNGLHYSELRG
jgi:hypothetical protein